MKEVKEFENSISVWSIFVIKGHKREILLYYNLLPSNYIYVDLEIVQELVKWNVEGGKWEKNVPDLLKIYRKGMETHNLSLSL